MDFKKALPMVSRLVSRCAAPNPTRHITLAIFAMCVAASSQPAAVAEPPKPDTLEFYHQQVEPLLKTACYECHSHASGEANGKLMVDSLIAMTDGGTRGPAVKPGEPDASPLFKAVTYAAPDLQMPPDGQLPAEQIEVLRAWIAAGAVAPKSERLSAKEMNPAEAAANHWSYQLPQPRFAPSAGKISDHIDFLINARLIEKGLALSPAADRATLLRRLHYDLNGLPPTADQVQSFVHEARDDEVLIAETVDTLLASPRFGERWARYWMDLARYADTKGYVFQEDREYPEAYRYRDWLVDAFNNDLPYTEFIQKQLAADLDSKGTPADIPALGFLTLGRRFLNNKNDIIDDRLDVVSRGLMGMTLACARCHDHKYDPVTQADYYALYGVFLNTEEPGGEPFAHRMVDAKDDRKSFILLRGTPGNRGAEVERRFVSFLSAEAPESAKFEGSGSGRTQLAAKIVDPQNPLTARVLANRVWLRLMGASLTESPSDFGTRAPAPLQQDVLDQMAMDFVQGGWSMKQLIRGIVLSRVYQQLSVSQPEAAAVDAANTLYWRANRRRRDFESLRDSLLAASGQLDAAIGGPAQKIHTQPFSHRRTIYAHIDRQNLPSVFRSFDFASPDSHSPSRPHTSVPQQGLYLMNSDFLADLASNLGMRAEQAAMSSGTEAALKQLFTQVFSREPDRDELALLTEFVAAKQEDAPGQVSSERWICGYGAFNAETKTLSDFKRLPKFTGEAWQGEQGPPDPVLGWCILNRAGGHPGNDLNFAVVRRWIAPRDGKLRISGQLKHEQKEGDGVRATILVDGAHELGQWTAHHSEAKTETGLMMVQAGQTVDFVTDCLTGSSHDSFRWQVRLRYQDGNREAFQSEKELPVPAKQPLDNWQQLAQALLASNEFAFVD